MFHHHLGMQESCVKCVLTGIRFCQQPFFLHQATLAAMASPSYPRCERKTFPVHLLDCWYSLALAAPHSKHFLTWKNTSLRSTLRHSPSRRLPGPRRHADMTSMGSVHSTTAQAGNCLLCITTHHYSGLWSVAFPGVCTNYFSRSRGSDSINWLHLTLAAVQAIEGKNDKFVIWQIHSSPIDFLRCPQTEQ